MKCLTCPLAPARWRGPPGDPSFATGCESGTKFRVRNPDCCASTAAGARGAKPRSFLFELSVSDEEHQYSDLRALQERSFREGGSAPAQAVIDPISCCQNVLTAGSSRPARAGCFMPPAASARAGGRRCRYSGVVFRCLFVALGSSQASVWC